MLKTDLDLNQVGGRKITNVEIAQITIKTR